MKRRFVFLSALALSLGLSSCTFAANMNNGDNIPNEGEPSWTIMVYMCGSDLESDHDYIYDNNGNIKYDNWGNPMMEKDPVGLATTDIMEMLSVKGQPKNVNIIIETGGATEWHPKYGIKANELGRYHIRDGQLVKDAGITNASMGKQSTFESFLEWGLTTYPADKTGVIMWNHGGALDGVCFDDNYTDSYGNADSLTNYEMKSALSNVFSRLNITEKLEWVGYDACLMAIQDIAEFNSSYFNYMVAAEETEMGEGWAYHTWVDDLYAKKDTKTILKAICDGFVDSVDEMLDGYYEAYGKKIPNDQNLAVLDLNQMANYKTKFESMASSVKSTIKGNLSNYRSLMKNVKSYADQTVSAAKKQELVSEYGYPNSWFSSTGNGQYVLHGYFLYGNFDVSDMLNKMKSSSMFSNYKDAIQEVIDALANVVVSNTTGGAAKESKGLCAIVPMDNYFEYKSNLTSFTNWRSIFA